MQIIKSTQSAIRFFRFFIIHNLFAMGIGYSVQPIPTPDVKTIMQVLWKIDSPHLNLIQSPHEGLLQNILNYYHKDNSLVFQGSTKSILDFCYFIQDAIEQYNQFILSHPEKTHTLEASESFLPSQISILVPNNSSASSYTSAVFSLKGFWRELQQSMLHSAQRPELVTPPVKSILKNYFGQKNYTLEPPNKKYNQSHVYYQPPTEGRLATTQALAKPFEEQIEGVTVDNLERIQLQIKDIKNRAKRKLTESQRKIIKLEVSSKVDTFFPINTNLSDPMIIEYKNAMKNLQETLDNIRKAEDNFYNLRNKKLSKKYLNRVRGSLFELMLSIGPTLAVVKRSLKFFKVLAGFGHSGAMGEYALYKNEQKKILIQGVLQGAVFLEQNEHALRLLEKYKELHKGSSNQQSAKDQYKYLDEMLQVHKEIRLAVQDLYHADLDLQKIAMQDIKNNVKSPLLGWQIKKAAFYLSNGFKKPFSKLYAWWYRGYPSVLPQNLSFASNVQEDVTVNRLRKMDRRIMQGTSATQWTQLMQPVSLHIKKTIFNLNMLFRKPFVKFPARCL